MSTSIESKNERINIRIESHVKNLIEKAAGFEGKTVSKFIVNSALERARDTIHEHEVMTLNQEHSKAMFDALTAPIAFSGPLTDALKEHSNKVIVR